MGKRFTGSRHTTTSQLVAVALSLTVAMIGDRQANAEPESSPDASPTSLRVTSPLDAGHWCRPVVNAAIDADPLSCWLHLAAEEPTMPPAMEGMNFGDQPPWTEIDLDAIAAELDRYEAGLEAERREAEQAAAARATPAPADTTPATPASSKFDSMSDEELDHQCFTLRVRGSCNALWDRLEGGGNAGAPSPDPAPAPEPEEDTKEYEPYDYSQHQDEHDAWIAEMNQRARDRIAEECGDPNGGSALWYSDGSIYVSCY